MGEIKNFTDLIVYKKSHELVLEIYSLCKKFPADERFALTDQMRRAAISIISNIAEGFSRSSSKDKAHFYAMAKGSLTEIYSQILISKDLRYISENESVIVLEKVSECIRLISGLIKSAMNR
jgi:four helix bundle protein